MVIFLYPTYEDTEYLEGGTSYINILRCVAVLLFAGIVLWMERREKAPGMEMDERFRFFFYLNLGALALYVFCGFLPMLLGRIPEKRWRRLFQAGICLAAVLYFAMYLRRAGGDGILLLPYRTFFFHDMVHILSDVN